MKRPTHKLENLDETDHSFKDTVYMSNLTQEEMYEEL